MTETQKKTTLGLAVASLVCGLFFWFPVLGFLLGVAAIVLGIVALVKINNNKDKFAGTGLAISGIVLGVFSIVIIPFIALLGAIAIPNFLRARLSANEALAQSTIRTIATAAETFQQINARYPATLSELTDAEPAHLSIDYTRKPISGYTYQYMGPMVEDVFLISAQPAEPGMTGSFSYCMTNEGVLRGDPEGGDINTTFQCEALEQVSASSRTGND